MALVAASRKFIAIAELVEVEIRNALELAVYRSPGTVEAVERTNDRFAQMMDGGSWRVVEVDFQRCLQRVRGLSGGHTRKTGCRSLDIPHVVGAMELGIRKFWSLDEKQCALARQVGLEVNL